MEIIKKYPKAIQWIFLLIVFFGFCNAFDFDKWAAYFAIIDVTGNFHGSIPKSVKLYYNPVTAKFEPIGFDGHYNPNLFQNFLIFSQIEKTLRNTCRGTCLTSPLNRISFTTTKVPALTTQRYE